MTVKRSARFTALLALPAAFTLALATPVLAHDGGDSNSQTKHARDYRVDLRQLTADAGVPRACRAVPRTLSSHCPLVYGFRFIPPQRLASA
ncbi:hypothetical protein GCM10009730_59600 [Streptomyces albidochromogenes]